MPRWGESNTKGWTPGSRTRRRARAQPGGEAVVSFGHVVVAHKQQDRTEQSEVQVDGAEGRWDPLVLEPKWHQAHIVPFACKGHKICFRFRPPCICTPPR